MAGFFAAQASPNIAIIKYWGKRNDLLKLPMNDSVSVTLAGPFFTETKVELSGAGKDSMEINGRPADDRELLNVRLVLDFLRKKAGNTLKATISTRNSFPEGTGIASSASGYAALASASAAALGLELSPAELSVAARLGSGSACRSVIGGFVHWKMGIENDGSDSYAVQVAAPSHWDGFRIVTAITTSQPKKIGSTDGMKRTVETSSLYRQRLEALPGRTAKVLAAIMKKDAGLLFRLAMEESNNLHAVMMDSYPPLFYLDDVSRGIIASIHELNEAKGSFVAGYSFDAGPNAHVFTTERYCSEVEALLKAQGVGRVVVSKPGPGVEVLGSDSKIRNRP